MRWHIVAVASALCAFAMTCGASASDGVISLVQDPGQPVQGPAGLFFKDGRFYVPDPVDQEVIVFDAEGAPKAAVSVPAPFLSALMEGETIVLYDALGQGLNFDVAQAAAQGRSSLEALPKAKDTYEQKLTEQHLAAEEQAGRALSAGRAAQTNVLSAVRAATANADIEDAKPIGQTNVGLAVYWLVKSGDDYEVFAGILSPQGELLGKVRAYGPENFTPETPFALDAAGNIWALLPSAAEPAQIVPVKVLLSTGKAAYEGAKGGGRAASQSDDADKVERDLAQAVRATADETFGRQTPIKTNQPIKRSEAVQRMRAFLDYEWLLEAKNYGRDGIPSECDSGSGHYWQRPSRLNGKVGLKHKALPYRWGGYLLTTDAYQQGLSGGRLAGDICTCKVFPPCVVKAAIGLDCSGSVSAAWRSDYYTTSSMHEITTPVEWKDLKPGDALNAKGSHVRMFIAYLDAGKTLVKTLESAKSCGGLCERPYAVSALKAGKYKPLKYKNIVDD